MKKLFVLLIAASIVSACGNKKTSTAPGTPAQPQSQPDAQSRTSRSGSNTTVDTTAPSAPSANNGQPNVAAPVLPAVPNQPGKPPKQGTPVPPAPAMPGPVDQGQLPVAYDPTKPNFDEHQTGKEFTGALTPDGMMYTGSSTDNVLAYLQSLNDTVSAEQKQANLRAAAQIVTAELKSDSYLQDVRISMQTVEPSGMQTYILGSVLSSEQAQPIQVVKEGTTGNQIITGTMKCIDFGGSCENILARLMFGPEGSRAVAYILFRHSNADLFVHFGTDSADSNNKEYRRLVSMITNTVTNKETEIRFDNYHMKSFEVVNGRSGIKIEMMARNNEFIGFKAPLIAPEIGTAVNIPVIRLSKDSEISPDLIKAQQGVKYNVASSLTDIRMINNNGLGQVRLQMKMRKVGAEPQEVLSMVFMRKIQPIVDLDMNFMK